jgi:hypothetical protein
MLETSRKDRDITMSENHVILFTIVLTKITTICHATHKSMILDLFPNIGFYNIQGYDDKSSVISNVVIPSSKCFVQIF